MAAPVPAAPGAASASAPSAPRAPMPPSSRALRPTTSMDGGYRRRPGGVTRRAGAARLETGMHGSRIALGIGLALAVWSPAAVSAETGTHGAVLVTVTAGKP